MSKDRPSSAIELLGAPRNEAAYNNRRARLRSACYCYRCDAWRKGDDRGVLGLCESCSGDWLTGDDDEIAFQGWLCKTCSGDWLTDDDLEL